MPAPEHLVVETKDKQCDVRQEEEYDGDGLKVALSYVDHEGARRRPITAMLVGNACALCGGASTADGEVQG